MFVCADCKEVACAQVGSDQNACDSFNGEADVTTDVYGDEVYTIKEAGMDIAKLRSMVIAQHQQLQELQRQFDAIISAVVKAASPEEDR